MLWKMDKSHKTSLKRLDEPVASSWRFSPKWLFIVKLLFPQVDAFNCFIDFLGPFY